MSNLFKKGSQKIPILLYWHTLRRVMPPTVTRLGKAANILALIIIGSLVLLPVLSGTSYKNMHATAQEAPFTVMEDSNASTGLSLYSGRKVHVEYISSASSILGTEIDSIQLKLRKVGSPSGDATVGTFDSKLALKKSFGLISVTSVSTSYKD